MNTHTPKQFKNVKERTIHIITGFLLDALIEEEITEAQGRHIAHYILEKKNDVSDNESLMQFLHEISKKWPIFPDLSSRSIA